MSENILEMKGIHKKFPGVKAVDNVDLTVKKGEVLALVGENGAGKSTLIKILSGAYTADSGQIILDGKELGNYSPREAIDLGISVIYQELNYLNDVTVAENIFLGMIPVKGVLKTVDYKKLKDETSKILDYIGLKRHPFELVSRLSVAEKQLLEVARACVKNVKVLVMDEPTSALNDTEIQNLFRIVNDLKEKGKSVIYISHKMDEIFTISDRIQVMRDGRCVGIFNTEEVTRDDIVKHMIGREIKEMYPIGQRTIGKTVFNVRNLSTKKVKGVSFSVRSGEIVGIYGLMGAGRTEIVKAIFGAVKKTCELMEVEGRKVTINNPKDAISKGIGYVPNERKTEGLIIKHTVKDNIVITCIKQLFNGIILNLRKERKIAEEWIRKLSIKTPGPYTIVESLSGGNQQKVVLAKWIMLNPKLLILNEPTRGIDVGAKVEIYKLMEALCKQGVGILVVSSELQEITAISDRIIVVSNGRITGECDKSDFDHEKIMNYAIAGGCKR